MKNESSEITIGQPFWIGIDCPNCGDAMCIEDNADGFVYDGDEAVCPDCGDTAFVSVDEDGDFWLQEPCDE